MITTTDLANYLGIDVVDDMILTNLERCTKAAESYLASAAGDYNKEDPKAKEVALMLASDMYWNRGYTTTSVTNNTRKLVSSMLLQLRLESGGDADGNG